MLYEPETSTAIESSEKKKHVNNAEAFPQPDKTQLQLEIAKARFEIKGQEYSWAGKTPLDLVDAVKEAYKKADISNEADVEELTKRFLIGFWGERALAHVPVDKAKTVYAAEEARPEDYFNYQISDVESAVGVSRKDILIRGYYLAQLESNQDLLQESIKNFTENTGYRIYPEDALETIKLQMRVLQRYDRAVQAWKDSQPENTTKDENTANSETEQGDTKKKSGVPTISDLMKWAVQDEIAYQENEGRGTWSRISQVKSRMMAVTNWSIYMLRQEGQLIFHDKDPNLTVKNTYTAFASEDELVQQIADKNAAKKVREPIAQTEVRAKKAQVEAQESFMRYWNSIYNDITVPDALLLNDAHKPVGTLEVKCYTPDEVEAWVDALEKSIRPTSPDDKPKEEASYEHYGQTGFQVAIYKNPAKMMAQGPIHLGFNPASYSEFLNMVNGEQASNLDFVPNGGDRMILRFTDDIPDPLLERLGDVMQEYGYTDFIIQKVGLKEEDITVLAQKMTKRDLPLVADNTDALGRKILTHLSEEAAWRENNIRPEQTEQK